MKVKLEETVRTDINHTQRALCFLQEYSNRSSEYML